MAQAITPLSSVSPAAEPVWKAFSRGAVAGAGFMSKYSLGLLGATAGIGLASSGSLSGVPWGIYGGLRGGFSGAWRGALLAGIGGLIGGAALSTSGGRALLEAHLPRVTRRIGSIFPGFSKGLLGLAAPGAAEKLTAEGFAEYLSMAPSWEISGVGGLAGMIGGGLSGLTAGSVIGAWSAGRNIKASRAYNEFGAIGL